MNRDDAVAGGGADPFRLGRHVFRSRLLLGTGKFASVAATTAAIRSSGAELVTVALRRFHPGAPGDDLMGPVSRLRGVTLVPNTSGARTAREAVRAAEVGRELSRSPFVKVEIHPNPHHLMPDPLETFRAARILVREGFVVLPYMPADPVLARRLEDAGCAAVMPLGSAIGSGQGLQTLALLRLIVKECTVPVVVDAGLRAPSEAAAALEMGCGAVLVNSAIANAEDPSRMAAAFAAAVRAGREARLAGLMPAREEAAATSPLTGFLNRP